MTAKRPFGFTDGVVATLGGLTVIAALVLTMGSPSFSAMYRDMGSVALPGLTRLVISPWWRAIAPAAVGALLAYALVRRPALAVAWIAILADIAIIAVWLAGLYAPIFTLAGNVSG